jgi:hypothetical protein
MATALLLVGCIFDRGGVQPRSVDAEDTGDASFVDSVEDSGDEQVFDSVQDSVVDAPDATDSVPIADGPADGPLADGPLPADALNPDTLKPCPATCPIACKPGTATCPKPKNVVATQLPSPCAALTVPQGSTWRLCSNPSTACKVVAGLSCNSLGPTCSGKAVTQVAAGGGQVCVFAFPALTVQAGATLQVRGAAPAILVVKGTATIAGTVDASALEVSGGAGGGRGGETDTSGKGASGVGAGGGQTCDCQTSEDNYDDCGGGGGGYATVGGSGGLEGGKFCSAGPSPSGGVTYGSKELVPLLGGSGGGAGDVGNAAQADPGDGGGGGGAIQISASTIVLDGAVLANGGAGEGGDSWSSTYPGGGGGGGSGGGILLEAITFNGSGWAMAAGGGGGGGGDDCIAGDGKQSKLVNNTEQPPTGGANCNSGGDGGTGAYGAPSAAGNGQSVGIWEGPGGGGGGAGFLRFNSFATSASCPPQGIKTSGAISCGVMDVYAP